MAVSRGKEGISKMKLLHPLFVPDPEDSFLARRVLLRRDSANTKIHFYLKELHSFFCLNSGFLIIIL